MSEFFSPIVTIPTQLENLQLPDPSLLMIYKNLENRTIWIDNDIDKTTLDVARYIQQYNMEDDAAGLPPKSRKPILILIHSDGGDAYVAFTIVDIMLSSVTPIHTVNIGSAMSAGVLLLLGGSRRFCTKHSRAMIHTGSAMLGGTYEQVESGSDDYKRMIKEMEIYILSRTGMDRRIFSRKKSKDWYLNSNDQLKYGLIDTIIGAEKSGVLH